MSSIRLDHFSGFDTLPADYQALWREHARSFDQTLTWNRAFAEHLIASNERLVILGAYDPDQQRPLAVLPLRRASRFRGPLPVRSLTALTNYYTALFEPVLAPDTDAPVVCDRLARGLVESEPDWNLLDLSPMAPEHAFFAASLHALRSAGCFVQSYFRFGNWYLEVGGRSFSEYFRDMPSRMRSTLTRKAKKLRARPDVRIEIVQRPADVDAALAAYEQIYARSWKQDEPHKDFIRAIARRFADEGWLRLGLVYVGEIPAAAQIWYAQGGTASIFKLAYDPAFGELSVGSVLSMTLMEHALDVDRVRVVDYLCGDDDYKKDWMSHRRERWAVRASPWLSLVGMTEAAQTAAGRLVRMARGQPRREPPVTVTA